MSAFSATCTSAFIHSNSDHEISMTAAPFMSGNARLSLSSIQISPNSLVRHCSTFYKNEPRISEIYNTTTSKFVAPFVGSFPLFFLYTISLLSVAFSKVLRISQTSSTEKQVQTFPFSSSWKRYHRNNWMRFNSELSNIFLEWKFTYMT